MTVDLTTIIFYIIIFLALYSQIFYLYSFLGKRKEYKKETNFLADDKDLQSVTFMIPCWNEAETIDKTIASVRALDYPSEKVHIVLVDDGSTDNTWEVLQRYQGQERMQVFTKENGGKHTALNFAIPHIQTELACSIDADTFIEKDALKKIASYFVRRPELSAVGGAVLIERPKTFAQRAQSVEYQMFAYSKKVLGMLDGVMVVPGAFSVFKKSALESIGGYKKAHNLEDLELTYRFQVNGYKVDHCHNAIVYTKGPDSIRALFRQRLRWSYGFINNTIDYKHAFMNRKYGNFGLFTVPMAVLAYIVILSIFFMSWYKIFDALIQHITVLKLAGATHILQSLFSFDWFLVNTQAIALLTLVVYGSFILSIYLGRKMSSISNGSYLNIIWFFVLYSAVVPFWVIKSVYNTAVANTPSWR
jgi:cellulose synthase/poly-beta-1,6-N-acetylglucosamine synthase-like glycosyltransferase